MGGRTWKYWPASGPRFRLFVKNLRFFCLFVAAKIATVSKSGIFTAVFVPVGLELSQLTGRITDFQLQVITLFC